MGAVSGLGLPPNVIRMPRGPAKGEGFKRWCNSRMKPEGAPAAPPAAPAAPVASAPVPAPVQQKQQQPLPQRKSRAIPIVAPPEAAAGAAEAVTAAPAAPVVDRNLVVNLDS